MAQNDSYSNDPLFRQEVFDAKDQEKLGTISLVPKVSFFVVSIVAAMIALALLALLFLGSYTRRITVTGQLIPTSGLIRVMSPQQGIVLEKHVDEGQQVKKGDVLYVLSSDRIGSSSVDLQAQIAQQISARIQSMEIEIQRNEQSEQTERSQLLQRLKYLNNETGSLRSQMVLQKQRVSIAKDTYQRYKGLADKDYVANEQLIEKQLELTEQETRLQALKRDVLNIQKEQAAAQREISDAKARYANLNSQLKRNISTAQQESTEVESRSSVIISAQQDGTATLVTAKVGQTMNIATPLMSLVPINSTLEARLYAPSNAIGFVKPGNKVLLRYQPYPYQKFGLYEGVVETISSTSVSSEELSGITLSDAAGAATSESVYSITVKPAQQFVTAYGEQRPLQSGMRLDADIMQENRKLYEWVLEPLYSITGRIR